jgi:hypothetical protein
MITLVFQILSDINGTVPVQASNTWHSIQTSPAQASSSRLPVPAQASSSRLPVHLAEDIIVISDSEPEDDSHEKMVGKGKQCASPKALRDEKEIIDLTTDEP